MNGVHILAIIDPIAKTGKITIRFQGRKNMKINISKYHYSVLGSSRKSFNLNLSNKNALTPKTTTKKLIAGISEKITKKMSRKSKS